MVPKDMIFASGVGAVMNEQSLGGFDREIGRAHV